MQFRWLGALFVVVTWAGGSSILIYASTVDRAGEKLHHGHIMAFKILLENYTNYFLSHFIGQRNSRSQLTSEEVSQGNVIMFPEGDENGVPAHSGFLVINGRKWDNRGAVHYL